MTALYIYYIFLSDIDIPYVTVKGLTIAIAMAINSSIMLFLIWLISNSSKAEMKKQIVFQDYIFFYSTATAIEYLLLNSGLAHNQSLDYVDCVYIFLLGYMFTFRFKHWGIK